MFGFGKDTKGGSGAEFAALQGVRAYWQALRDGQALPRRDRIDPRGLASSLEHVFLAEQIAPGHARIRLAGMQVNDLLGMDLRGMPLTALLDPQSRARLTEALDVVFTGTSALALTLEAERGIGRPALEARMILLPLIGTQGEPNLALGCLCSRGEIGRTPRRLVISRLEREPLNARLVTMELAEAPAAYTPPPPRGKPQLRLVSSRD